MTAMKAPLTAVKGPFRPSRIVARLRCVALVLGAAAAGVPEAAGAAAPTPPYDVFPPAEPPYYRARYDAGTQPGELVYPVNYTVWIPPGVAVLRGVVVHQHGCGEGSCRSGLTGAYDLHWQALARAHDCALLAPAYEQPEKAECQSWCDPRNGSADAFQRALADLGAAAGHPELATVPWALWGHSGGGHWCGGMAMLFPERVAAVWLRSGVPLVEPDPDTARIKAHEVPDLALGVPMMCNPGTKEGVTVKDGRFAGVWPANERFFRILRGRGGLVGVAVDPLSAHECGNQRYLAIPWLDACLKARLPTGPGPLRAMPAAAWVGPITGGRAVPAGESEAPLEAAWLPDERIAGLWTQYVADTAVSDESAPPAPRGLRVAVATSATSRTVDGTTERTSSATVTLTWEPVADLESGLAGFVVERDGEVLARVPEDPKNPFGRPLFQSLQYSDTPTQPLAEPRFTDAAPGRGRKHVYRVRTVNTVGLESPPCDPVTVAVGP